MSPIWANYSMNNSDQCIKSTTPVWHKFARSFNKSHNISLLHHTCDHSFCWTMHKTEQHWDLVWFAHNPTSRLLSDSMIDNINEQNHQERTNQSGRKVSEATWTCRTVTPPSSVNRPHLTENICMQYHSDHALLNTISKTADKPSSPNNNKNVLYFAVHISHTT